GAPLRIGSTGRAVKEVQYYLYLMSAYYTEIPVIAFDGIYGTATAEAVRAYQRLFGLAVDGVVGPARKAGLKAGWPQTGRPEASPNRQATSQQAQSRQIS
ncbi:MAG: peptidoglycan-binding protein, partial [Actinomyces graevenitzii]|nr:peptidoglycan-binding protein [Actinomyces graevenitzii]